MRPAITLAFILLASRVIAQAPPAQSDLARQPLVIERYTSAARFEADGTGREVVSVRVRVQNEGAVQSLGQLEFAFSSATQRLDVDSVIVHKAGGGTVVTPASSIQDVTGPIHISISSPAGMAMPAEPPVIQFFIIYYL